MDHSTAPVLDALADYRRLGRYGFTPPGHRQGRAADPRVREVLGDALRSDILASPGMDDRLARGHHLSDAEELMADAVGADYAFFSTCGSSLSVKAAMMAVAGGDGGLILGRDSHKSIVAGLVFSGVRPYWIAPRWDAARHFSHPPAPAQVRETWQAHPEAAGALIVSPSPYGTCADIAGIAAVCHEYGKPLIVDEAWGAHLPFHPDLPTWAMDAGADICVVSVHKMGAGFEQGSVFHVQGDLVNRDRLRRCADLLMTTSPNVLLYAAIDGWRRQMVEHGYELLSTALEVAAYARGALDAVPDISVMEDELLGVEASHDLDRLQVLMDVSATGATGYEIADWLREQRRLDVGHSDHRRILATLSMSDDKQSIDALVDGLAAWRIQLKAPAPQAIRLPAPHELQLATIMPPRAAFFGPHETVPIDAAPGRIAAEQVTPYPPGIPVIVPGELIDTAVIDYLRTGIEAGMNVPDPADPHLRTLRVVPR
ncbi:aminotransferase class I/II-fold pyridoxal phosphate-dependent enzyme [Nocardia aurantiaca]|uniref:Ornithine decarboxylase n=1 Tax=Nocardia aurantiaca TaxID=2675850 RepID=A0A6I3L1N3_9NOCA|nr:ornithine decarboxylase [Nocardia aurantiaca]MTE15727.1 ornithine decarboxylase [Nocardia aurantiaca]